MFFFQVVEPPVPVKDGAAGVSPMLGENSTNSKLTRLIALTDIKCFLNHSSLLLYLFNSCLIFNPNCFANLES